MLRQLLGRGRALRSPLLDASSRCTSRALFSAEALGSDGASASQHLRFDTLERIAVRPRRHRFRVALVGRTNVGKSTLFNRLTKSRAAIVHDVPGTTRDRRYAPVTCRLFCCIEVFVSETTWWSKRHGDCFQAQLAGMEFDVIDTGGLEDSPSGSLEEGMLEQTRRAVHEADLVFFLVDGRQGVTPIDSHFARWLRRENADAPVHLVANKVEGYPDRFEDALSECYQLGMGDPIPLSAEHGEGTTHLLDVLIPAYDAFEKQQDEVEKQWEAENSEDGEKIVDDEDEDVSGARWFDGWLAAAHDMLATVSHHQARDRRPAERGQVDAAQQDRAQGACADWSRVRGVLSDLCLDLASTDVSMCAWDPTGQA